MWLLFHRKAKTRAVPNGLRFTDTCPDCKLLTTFTEVEVTEKVGMFFVDVVDTTERAYRCASCDAVFDRQDDGEPVAPVTRSATQLARDAHALEQRRLAEVAEHRDTVARKAVRIEDELAELKKRLGR